MREYRRVVGQCANVVVDDYRLIDGGLVSVQFKICSAIICQTNSLKPVIKVSSNRSFHNFWSATWTHGLAARISSGGGLVCEYRRCGGLMLVSPRRAQVSWINVLIGQINAINFQTNRYDLSVQTVSSTIAFIRSLLIMLVCVDCNARISSGSRLVRECGR